MEEYRQELEKRDDEYYDRDQQDDSRLEEPRPPANP